MTSDRLWRSIPENSIGMLRRESQRDVTRRFLVRNIITLKLPSARSIDILGAFATIHGLAREGRVGKRGMPKNLLQLAATGRAYTKHGSFDAAMPIALQVSLSATLGRLAEALGYRAVYERYLR